MRLDWTPAGGAAMRIDRDPRWTLLGVAGHGAPDTTLRTAGTPDRDERLAVHAPAQPRIVTLHLQIRGADLAAFERNRATLAAAFAPWRDSGLRARPGILTATLADGRVRALRALPRQGLSWAAGRQRGAQALESISLEASDPFWYDPAGVVGRLRIGQAGALRFSAAGELGFPAGFGSDLPSAQARVRNPGSVRSFPVLRVAGPSVNPQFRLGATGRQLAFALTVPPGISLRVRCGAQAGWLRRRARRPPDRRPGRREQRAGVAAQRLALLGAGAGREHDHRRAGEPGGGDDRRVRVLPAPRGHMSQAI